MTQTVLDKIKAYKLEEVATAKAARPLAGVEEAARFASPTRGFADALRRNEKWDSDLAYSWNCGGWPYDLLRVSRVSTDTG